MDEISYQIVQGFNLKAKNIIKSKYMYICKTSTGTKVIKPTTAEQNNLIFAHNVKEYLYKNGFINIDRFYTSIQNKPFYIYNANTYVMTDYIDYPELDLSNSEQLKQTIKTMALFHKTVSSYKISESEIPAKTINIPVYYKKKFQKLNNFKKNINSQSHMSDFDVKFLKNYGYFCSEAQESLEIINSINCNKIFLNENKKYICHNQLKEENIPINNTIVYIINFNNCSNNHYILDLAYFINRYIRKHDENYVKLPKLLDDYSSINSLGNNECKALYALLKFPEKYIKICESFYSKKRSWIPNSVSNQLDVIINKKNHHKEYINCLK